MLFWSSSLLYLLFFCCVFIVLVVLFFCIIIHIYAFMFLFIFSFYHFLDVAWLCSLLLTILILLKYISNDSQMFQPSHTHTHTHTHTDTHTHTHFIHIYLQQFISLATPRDVYTMHPKQHRFIMSFGYPLFDS